MSVYISLFTVEIPVNYTSEFRKLFEANTYISEVKENLNKLLKKSQPTKYEFYTFYILLTVHHVMIPGK